ncbi:MAG: HAD family hydrolase [Treponemataceae bacterium]|nr:MAG: HAD family hydrolase [Treponemataceae bacterium]
MLRAVAFDIDGTLYSTFKLYVRLIPYALTHLRFFAAYSRVRAILHRSAPLADFFGYQSRLLADVLGISAEEARVKIDTIVYDGLKPYLEKTKPFKHVLETVQVFRDAGLKIAILSDFPPEQKGSIWGIRPLCDVIVGSEELGALKPSKYAFGLLAKRLELNSSEILYVGNSVFSDINGAKAAGMKSAYIMTNPLRRLFRIKQKNADISFGSYRQLQKIVLELLETQQD